MGWRRGGWRSRRARRRAGAGKSPQRTLVIDASAQSNLAAEGIGGLLGHDRRSPAAFYAAGREELARYPSVQLLDGDVLRGERGGDGLVLELADGGRATARRVVLATGVEHRYPALPGIPERWGRSVFHCLFCHGREGGEAGRAGPWCHRRASRAAPAHLRTRFYDLSLRLSR
jgi:thioredoxin reductase